VYFKYGITILTLKFIVFISILIIIGMIDFDTTDVYFSTTVTGMILGVVSIIAEAYLKNGIITYVLGGILGGGLIALIIIVSKIIIGTEGMGWGDAEICLVCGLFLGLKLIIVMLIVSFVLGGIIGVALIVMKIKSREDYIPFGPFIVFAAVFTVFFGQGIVSYYFSMLMR
jgi:leader peptidase (prepilin peptidase)/N-methyltransferase